MVGDVDETEGVKRVCLELEKAPGGDDGPRGSSAGGSGDCGRSALTSAVRGAVVSCSFGRIAETAAIGKMPPHRRTAAIVRSSAELALAISPRRYQGSRLQGPLPENLNQRFNLTGHSACT